MPVFVQDFIYCSVYLNTFIKPNVTIIFFIISCFVTPVYSAETAINIGYSCQLLTDDMVEVFIIDAYDFDSVQEDLKRFRESIKNVASAKNKNSNCNVISFTNEGDNNSTFHEESHNENFGGFALVVNGHSLVCICIEDLVVSYIFIQIFFINFWISLGSCIKSTIRAAFP